MNKLVLLLLVLGLGVSCTSYKAKKAVNAEAAEVMPVVNPTLQYHRAVAMIEANPDLSQEQKAKLVELINGYANKAYESKQKESQFRTVLMDEMLKTNVNNNAKISAAREDITKLNKESSKMIETFVQDFKTIVGKSAHYHQPVMMEVILVE